ncbi:Uncharacterized conserved protein YndB, AHSA1/START domain [Paenibacillaceae bacterium GAS479]|nr:Uncharacterized conserved protein YndB, AHSA1/START domain [Paenibacillaceae bacterium GAS479]
MSLVLSVDHEYKTTIEKAWTYLTDPSKLSKWILENDFKAVEGHRFQFRAEPNQYWDGVINGEVLLVDEPNKLSYTWAVGEEKHTVIWTLQDLGNGKVNLHLEQTGFSNVQGLEGARYGWGNWTTELEKLLAQ